MPERNNKLQPAKSLSKPELQETLAALSSERGLDPFTLERFLKLDPESVRPLGKIDIIYPIATIVIYAGIKAIFETYPTIPKGLEWPRVVHNFLQALWGLGSSTAASAAILDHLPSITLLLGGIWGIKNTLPKFLRGDSFVDKVTRDEVARNIFTSLIQFN